MPIKLPKGFQRRKSSGNALEELQNSSEPSFRVLARPGSSGQALDIGTKQPRTVSQPFNFKNSFEEDSEDLFSVVTRPDAANRGSGGTNNSASTAPYDSATSSSRMSTASTNPSSIDTKSDNNLKSTVSAPYNDIPAPPPHAHAQRAGFLRNAGRTFSFGVNRKSHEINDLPPPPPVPSIHQKTPTSSVRDRSMTASSTTTATPPRLDDGDFAIPDSGLDGFGNMFDSIGSKQNRDLSATPLRQYASSPTSQLPSIPQRSGRHNVPLPLHLSQNDQFESSPYSWTSQDGLLRSPSPSKTATQTSPQIPSARMVNSSTSLVRRESDEDNIFEDTPLQHKSSSVRAPPSSFPSSFTRERGSTIKSRISERSSSEVPAIDPALLANAELATRYQDTKVNSPKMDGKVMTPAQFERYKQQKEETRKYNKVFGKADSDGSGDDYEDDEEDELDRERERKAIAQRKKQEAHLAVYRQQMMKVTGERPSDNTPERPSSSHSTGPARNSSTFDIPSLSIPNPARNSSTLDIPSLGNRFSQITVDGKRSSSGGKSSQGEEEDEDVPLGILAAHGFPNKNRPPSKLMSSSSNPNLRGQAQAQPQAAEANNRDSRLPAFARHLPPDPYYGASIVQPSHRESLAMNRNSMAMQSHPNLVLPQASGAATAHPLHPAGLVGVIAGEERARALRRGSPNAPGGYEFPPHPGMQRSQTMGSFNGMGMPMPGMMMPGMPGMLSPGDQAQLQMSQQMTQMMQMQMQWMQFMTSQMGQPTPGGMPPDMMGAQGVPQSPMGMPPVSRPQSVPLQAYPNQGQRTMSTLSPSMANWTHSSPAIPQISQVMNPQYTPSIAPSERSNVGMASRYRPVSMIQPEPEPVSQKRSSTFTSSTFRPWSHFGRESKIAPQSTLRTVPSMHDDEDDEQGWAELKAKKEQKKRSWKLRRGNDTSLQELYNAPA